jgi:hypothetical protein
VPASNFDPLPLEFEVANARDVRGEACGPSTTIQLRNGEAERARGLAELLDDPQPGDIQIASPVNGQIASRLPDLADVDPFGRVDLDAVLNDVSSSQTLAMTNGGATPGRRSRAPEVAVSGELAEAQRPEGPHLAEAVA